MILIKCSSHPNNIGELWWEKKVPEYSGKIENEKFCLCVLKTGRYQKAVQLNSRPARIHKALARGQPLGHILGIPFRL